MSPRAPLSKSVLFSVEVGPETSWEPFQFLSVSKSSRSHLVPSSLGAVLLAPLSDKIHPLCEVTKSEEGLLLLFVMLGQANTQNPQGWCLSDALLLPDECSVPVVTSVLSICLWKDKFFLFSIPGLIYTGLSFPTETVLLLFCDIFVLFF